MPAAPGPTTAGPGGAVPLDLRGAARAAALALLVLAALPVLGGLLIVAGNPAIGLAGFLGLVGGAMAAAMGASVEISAGVGSLGGGFSVSLMPLTGTLAALVVLGAGTVRALPRAGLPAAALVRHLAVTLGMFLAGLLVAGLVGQIAVDQVLGSGVPGVVAGVEVSIGLVGALVGGLLMGTAALAIAVAWKRRDLLPPALRPAADRLAGPAVAVRTTLVLVAVATVLVALVLAIAAAGESGTSVATLAVVLGYLPNLTLLVLGFGAGIPLDLGLSAPITALARAGGLPTSFGLGDLLALDGRWWFVPVVVAFALVAGGVHMALAAPDRHVALARGWMLAPTWVVVLLVGAALTGIRAGGSAPVPVLGQLTISGHVHLAYGFAILVGLGAGLAAGVAGALVARVLPQAVIDGFRGRVPGRRTAMVAAVIALLCAFTVPTAWAAVGAQLPPTPPVPPTPVPTTGPAPTSSSYPYYLPDTYDTVEPGPTTTAAVPTTAGDVQLSASAAAHPDASSVQTLLTRYYAAINARDYDAWSQVVTAKVAADQPRDQWERNYSTTRDDQVVVHGITTSSAGDALADVSFHSTQSPTLAPKDLPVSSICWRMTYPVDTTGAVIGPALRGSVRKSAC